MTEICASSFYSKHFVSNLKFIYFTQLTFTCSMSIIETLEKGVKHAYNKNTGAFFTPFSCVSIVKFEQVNVS